jgi:hypothetical protein
MSPEPTPTATPAEGQVPEGEGQAPEESKVDEPKGKTFDEAYVKQLRKEAAAQRTALTEATAELSKLKDKDKSETERLTERVAESDRRASAAETRLARYEVIADRGLDVRVAAALAGETREEIEASADAIAQVLAEQAADKSKPPSFDGGARKTPDATKPPEQEHNDFLLRAMGRTPNTP